jgi:hypothetical protein
VDEPTPRVVQALPSSLEEFVDEAGRADLSLVVFNRSGPAELTALLDRAFETQSVDVADVTLPAGPDDVVCLVEDGRVAETTPFSRLAETFLLVNADRYRTAAERRRLPDVLTGLDGAAFEVRGFPASNKEKLLLVVVSRFVEWRALDAGAGELHATFQRLSRLDDEHGTRQVYERLAASGVDTHVYGVRDDPTAAVDLDVTVHGGDHDEYRDSWVVLFAPPDGPGVALVAVETGSNRWRGTWFEDGETVARVRAYLDRRF